MSTALARALGGAAAAGLTGLFGDGATQPAAIGLATGVPFGGLLVVADPARRAAVLLGTLVAAVLVHLLDFTGWPLAFALVETLAAAAGAWLALRLRKVGTGALLSRLAARSSVG